jgi:hypothetical protein
MVTESLGTSPVRDIVDDGFELGELSTGKRRDFRCQ